MLNRAVRLTEAEIIALEGYRKTGQWPGGNAQQSRQWSENGDEASLSTVVSRPIKTLPDLYRECEIDEAVWTVGPWSCKAWTTTMKLGGEKGDRVVQSQNYAVSAKLTRRVSRIVEAGCALIVERMKRHAPRYPKLPKFKAPSDPHMMELDIWDAHFGKLAWAAETGENYDLKIAESIYANAVDDLLAKTAGYNIEKFVFPIGNDFFNIDNIANTTTAGTAQDVDGRYAKIFETGFFAVVRAIEKMAAIAPVEVLLIPGNHDETTSWHLAFAIKAKFHGNDRVTVDDRPIPSKYVAYGITLIGYNHADKTKRKRLPTLMAEEVPDLWAKSKRGHREWRTGHLHQEGQIHYLGAETIDGIVVRTLSSMSGTDKWHKGMSYTGSRRAAQAFLYSFARGYSGHFESNVPDEAYAA